MPFSGRAFYDTGVFDGTAEDVSDQISMISPSETPLLDALGDAPRAASNVLHEWLEDSLNPNTIISSGTLAPATTALPAHVNGLGVGNYFQVGTVMKVNRTGEYMQLSQTTLNTLTLTRGAMGTVAATIAAGDDIAVISDAALEGADVTVDTSRSRTRLTNYTQIFKKDIIVSGTVQAVNMLGGIADEFAYQKTKKLREMMRDFEKAVILGKLSGNTIGSSTAYRTMRGIWDFITTNVTSTGTLNPDVLDNIIEGAWAQGATDTDIIVVDNTWKRVIDQLSGPYVRVTQTDTIYRRKITTFEGSYGSHQVVMSRWMPKKSLMVLSSNRVRVVPLRGRSFQFDDTIARTGDSKKGMVFGEYTVEVLNQEGLAKAFG
jgi:hypothetical protein